MFLKISGNIGSRIHCVDHVIANNVYVLECTDYLIMHLH